MRLFIAIKFEEKILDSLTDFQDVLRGQGVSGNYTRRENLHITLAFIGDYGNPDEVLDVMDQVDFSPIKISFECVGSFGDLFWVGLADNPKLTSYVKRLRRGLSDNSIPFDRKKFSPHITLIRKYSCRGGRKISVPISPMGTMTVTRISLMRSERGKNGMIYTELGNVGVYGKI